MIKKSYYKLKHFLDKYERYFFTLTLAFGFIIDSLTLRRIDLLIENLVIIAYLSIAIFCILFLNAFKKRELKNRFLVWLNLILPLVLQFAFGGLFSVFMVFYTRSSSFLVSWPFLLILFVLLLGNELFRKRYERLNFHLSILYLAFFAYSVFVLPVLIGRIGADIFLASGAMSLALIFLVVLILYRIDKEAIKINGLKLSISIIAIYAMFNFLYFANIIPPIPLAMKNGGVYHGVARIGTEYRLLYERPERYEFWRETASVYHWKKGERVYIFSSVFAPAKFNQKIYHRWLSYDEAQKKWIEKDLLSFAIVGGRDNGFRGYSYKTVVMPGDWRVDVITDRGQVLGRVRFEIKERENEIEYEEGVDG